MFRLLPLNPPKDGFRAFLIKRAAVKNWGDRLVLCSQRESPDSRCSLASNLRKEERETGRGAGRRGVDARPDVVTEIVCGHSPGTLQFYAKLQQIR